MSVNLQNIFATQWFYFLKFFNIALSIIEAKLPWNQSELNKAPTHKIQSSGKDPTHELIFLFSWINQNYFLLQKIQSQYHLISLVNSINTHNTSSGHHSQHPGLLFKILSEIPTLFTKPSM